MLSPIERIYFWSTIMRDHSEFFLIALSSREIEYIKKAEEFKKVFIDMGDEIKKNSTLSYDLLDRTESIIKCFYEFKINLLNQLLNCKIELNFPPTFINHMINELLEFNRELIQIRENKLVDSDKEIIELHKLWLPDAAGHAASIASTLDPSEKELIMEAKKFEKEFNSLHIKALEVSKIIERIGRHKNALNYLSIQAFEAINNFIFYLEKIYQLRLECKVLGNLSPLFPNHMIREEQYYLANIEINE